MADDAIEVYAVTPDRLGDLEDLFLRPGPRGGTPPAAWSWCMWWRQRSHDAARNRRAKTDLLTAGPQPGLLA